MAKRKRGGQPGNKNAKGHRGANAYSQGARTASDRQRAARAASRGQRVKGPLLVRLKNSAKGNLRYANRNRRALARKALANTAQGALSTAAVATGIALASGVVGRSASRYGGRRKFYIVP